MRGVRKKNRIRSHHFVVDSGAVFRVWCARPFSVSNALPFSPYDDLTWET
jgi:hypothetical protein